MLITHFVLKKVAQLAGTKVKPYFRPSVFAKLQQGDPQGRVSIISLFNYVMRKVWVDQTRIGLSVYDSTGQGKQYNSICFWVISSTIFIYIRNGSWKISEQFATNMKYRGEHYC